jgi:hypothetical protein
MPAIDIRALFDQIAATPTLADSVKLMMEALGTALPALRELVPHPDDPNRKVAAGVLLGEALTRNTSHVAVDPRHPGYAHAHRMLTEQPELDKAAHIAHLEHRLAARDADVENLIGAVDGWTRAHAEAKADHAAALDALEAHARQLAAKDAALATAAEIAAANAQRIEALTAHVESKTAETEASKAAHAAVVAQLEAAKAMLSAPTAAGGGSEAGPAFPTAEPEGT